MKQVPNTAGTAAMLRRCAHFGPVWVPQRKRGHQGGPRTDKNGWCKANYEEFK